MGHHRHTDEAELLSRAIALAASAHGGQTDKAGEPYILHPLRVMLALRDPEERMAAVLHDVVEDTDVTLAALLDAGFPPAVVQAVDSLSRRKGPGTITEDYFSYIKRLKQDPIARAVKMADLQDNYLNPDRRGTLRPELFLRYSRAWEMLTREDEIRPAHRAQASDAADNAIARSKRGGHD